MKTHGLHQAMQRPAGKRVVVEREPTPVAAARFGVARGLSKQWTHFVFDDFEAAVRRSNSMPGTFVVKLIPGGMHNFTGEVITADSVKDAQLAADFARATGVEQRINVETRRGQFAAVVATNGLLTRSNS